MAETLSAERTLEPEKMWSYMRRLLDRLYGVLDSDSVMDDCLDIIVDLLGADRGLILVTHADGGVSVVNARGQKKSLTVEEREEISKTVIRQALDSNECVVWDPLAGADVSKSFTVLGILCALAAPLHSRGKPHGVLYLDFRDRRKFVGPQHVEFFMGSAMVLGAILEQHRRAEGAREQLREAQAHCMDARRAPPLADLLAAPSLGAIRREVESAIHGTMPILVTGESGTGKTLLAQAIAEGSGRRPIVRAMLGASDDLNTITSELFGHERGAFSGAATKRVGLVEFANGGTLILDEILNLPSHAQQLLLDFTQFGTYRPLGFDRAEPKRATVRIVAATNGDLRAAIRERRFREDLYYRLAGITLELPPLRERREDIPVLAEATLRRVEPSRRWTLSVALRRLLVSPSLTWSGNVRQLERAVERARERAVARDPEATELMPEHFESRDIGHASIEATEVVPQDEPIGVTWQKLQAERARTDEREQALLKKALDDADGVVAQAARSLGIARTTLSSRMDNLGLRPARRAKTEADG